MSGVQRSVHRTDAFVLRELLALLLTASAISLVAIPSTANNRTSSHAARCLNNLRHLTVAWQLYADDNHGRLVHNMHGGDAVGGAAAANPRFSPWAMGWLTWGLDIDNTNTAFLRTEKYARLSPYLPNEKEVHKCPADAYLSAAQRTRGWKERTRSVVMNGTLGNANFAANAGPFDVGLYVPVLKMSELIYPSPGETSVFLDEHPDSINDPFFFPPRARSWTDLPANLHNGAASFSFADGHVELHQWSGSLGTLGVHHSSGMGFPAPRPNDPNLHWVSYGSQRRSEKSY